MMPDKNMYSMYYIRHYVSCYLIIKSYILNDDPNLWIYDLIYYMEHCIPPPLARHTY